MEGQSSEFVLPKVTTPSKARDLASALRDRRNAEAELIDCAEDYRLLTSDRKARVRLVDAADRYLETDRLVTVVIDAATPSLGDVVSALFRSAGGMGKPADPADQTKGG